MQQVVLSISSQPGSPELAWAQMIVHAGREGLGAGVSARPSWARALSGPFVQAWLACPLPRATCGPRVQITQARQDGSHADSLRQRERRFEASRD